MQQVITRIKNEMLITFNEMMKWFNAENTLQQYTPQDGGWNVAEILEHVSLTNFYLLILIRKSRTRALQQALLEDYQELLRDYSFEWDRMQQVGEPDAFYWNRPEHMQPTGTAELALVKATLRQQLQECMIYLDELKNGEGVAYKMMMSVNGLGKIDVYHYIYFLVQHAKRHLRQMERIRNEFDPAMKQVIQNG
ncbi:DinB family protein [Taibaiella soli]|uniref:DinB family protein n=1 Tax=Taibaiella soli TaxID=1649169 RepID=A0A2W2AWM0_9BACT|nr:DinB family protein [Taibaiella soli]PZF72098.1 DinB family protein [Taibaiella soli]